MRAGADSDSIVTAQFGGWGAFSVLETFLVFGGRLGRRISWFQLGVAGFFIFLDRLSAYRWVRAEGCESVQTRDLSFAFFSFPDIYFLVSIFEVLLIDLFVIFGVCAVVKVFCVRLSEIS
jgi:hypothetical protein